MKSNESFKLNAQVLFILFPLSFSFELFVCLYFVAFETSNLLPTFNVRIGHINNNNRCRTIIRNN